MQAVLLAVDGTLVDSNDAHAESWVDAFLERGYDIPFDRIRPLIGMGGDRLILVLASIEEDSAEGQEILDARKEIFLRDYVDADFDGAMAVYDHPADLLQRFDYSPFAASPARLERTS